MVYHIFQPIFRNNLGVGSIYVFIDIGDVKVKGRFTLYTGQLNLCLQSVPDVGAYTSIETTDQELVLSNVY